MKRSVWAAMLAMGVGCSTPGSSGGDAGSASAPDAGGSTASPDAGDAPVDAGESGESAPDAGVAENAPDAGTVEVGNPCSASGLLVCDDFESAAAGGPPSPATWQVQVFNGEGSLAIDDTVAHSGSKSVHVNGTGTGGFRYDMFATKKPFPIANNTFYARVFIRSNSAMGDGHSTYFGGQQLDGARQLRVGFQHFMLETNLTHPTSEWGLTSGNWNDPTTGVQFVPGQWHCLEALFDGQNHAMRVWFEGNEVTSLHTTDWNAGLSNWSPNYEIARFGFETYHGEQAELWYDDVAIGTERIGCR